MPVSSAELYSRVAAAIRQLRNNIRWKPGKSIAHLRTRQAYEHLSASATIEDYEAIIAGILSDDRAQVYLYHWRDGVLYPTVVATYAERIWLVMFSLDAIMETAFPPSEPEVYLADERFRHLGTMKELLA